MTTESIDHIDFISLFGEETTEQKKRYYCDVEDCSKSYCCRQNLYRHKSSHKQRKQAKLIPEATREREAALHRERELLIETFTSYYDNFGEEEAKRVMKNNKKLKEHLIPLRKIMEADIAERLADAKESQSIVERELTEFKNAISVDDVEEKAAFKAVIRLVKKADHDSIGHLKQFSKVISSLTNHMAHYSENVNPKFKQARALKEVLDELFTEAMDDMGVAADTPPSQAKAKRKAGPTVEVESGEEGTYIRGAPNGSAKKTRGGFGHFLNTFLGNQEDEDAALREEFDDMPDR
ncbi:hypothetical protein EON65_41225 [archaeon]|nr:MAG: hypothetical protein EON65_41225 [archaeon]